MNVFKQLGLVIGVCATVLVYAPAVASATTVSDVCTVKATGSKNTAGAADSRFVLNNDNTVSATFIVTGSNCTQDVTIASWQAPDADKGRPYDQQKLFAWETGTFAPGQHTITVKLPNCYYQVDLIRGKSASGPNGSAVYDDAALMGSLHGGTTTCTPVTPPTPTPPTPPQPPVTPPTLPKTGVGTNVLWAAGLATVLGTVWYHRRQQKAARS